MIATHEQIFNAIGGLVVLYPEVDGYIDDIINGDKKRKISKASVNNLKELLLVVDKSLIGATISTTTLAYSLSIYYKTTTIFTDEIKKKIKAYKTKVKIESKKKEQHNRSSRSRASKRS